ncbi:site-specific integrase [Sinomonas sp. JGH33]|uniref:Site-specific integrase n=1 Tax=Sinomonas terricola TaxID=3110330 RepID=A0ABU5TDT6_9MICC|nr:site-specific integrase [Sinomonas sp. JGH33]MEA5457251.1 site-specific integrase [Sinomonas sp. JGH33]
MTAVVDVVISGVSITEQAGGPMLVQRVIIPGSRVESWTVLGDDDVPVAPLEAYLAFLSAIERSPNTVKAYAHDLKDFFVFLAHRDLDWRRVTLEDVGGFVEWLRMPPAGRTGQVAVLPVTSPQVGPGTINRKLAAVSSFYQHQARHGVELSDLLVRWAAPGGRSSWKPFLHHISKGRPQRRREIALKAPAKLPRVLTVGEVQSILDACTRLRDRFLFAVLFDTGMRIGEVLGLRHDDLSAAEREVRVVAHLNENGARAKTGRSRTVPVSAELLRLYSDYLHLEYGDLDNDYVFVNLWGGRVGHALSYRSVYDLVGRLRRRTGVDFDPHWFRHSAATRMLRDSVPLEVVSTLLGHASVTTTIDTYGHLTAEDARTVLEKAGWFAGTGVTL